jgi:hypothetical protein
LGFPPNSFLSNVAELTWKLYPDSTNFDDLLKELKKTSGQWGKLLKAVKDLYQGFTLFMLDGSAERMKNMRLSDAWINLVIVKSANERDEAKAKDMSREE